MPAIRIRLDPGGGPPYEQIQDAIRTRIGRGSLLPGDRIPTVRGLAADLELAPNTVARAYRDLERDGWVVGKGRAGTFVGDRVPDVTAEAELRTAAGRYVRRARQLGANDADVRTAVGDALR